MAYKQISIDKFTFVDTSISGLIIVEPSIYRDSRGYFMECYHRASFYSGGIVADFVQDNQSLSSKGVLRGLHYQKNRPQGKLVRVLKGEIYDVAVDLRRNSSTYGRWQGFHLSEENKKMVYIPESFAHGFLVLSDIAEVTYKCTDFYDPQDENGIVYNDPDLAIKWPVHEGENLIISEKDRKLSTFRDYDQQR